MRTNGSLRSSLEFKLKGAPAGRSNPQHPCYLSRSDRYYLKKTTKYVDRIWTYFARIEDDFRLLHMPLITK